MVTNSCVALDVSSASPVSVSDLTGFICCWPLAHGCALLAACLREHTRTNMLYSKKALCLMVVVLVNSQFRPPTSKNEMFLPFQ